MGSIVVIDSGIDINFKEFKNKKIKALNINTYETSIESIKGFNRHGTACASEILRINLNANIYIELRCYIKFIVKYRVVKKRHRFKIYRDRTVFS